MLEALLVGAIVVHLAEVHDIGEGMAGEISSAVAGAIDARTTEDVRSSAAACRAVECRVALAPPQDEIVSLVLVGGPTRTLVHAERYTSDRRTPVAQFDIAINAGAFWEPEIEQLVGMLFPQAPASARTLTFPPPTDAVQPTTVIAWVSGGLAVVAAGIAVGFGVSSKLAFDDLEREPMEGEPALALAERASAHRTIGFSALGACILFSGIMTVALVFD